jgi:hypothetical protein
MARDRETSVLVNLLPGLREIRAPLAAGYLFLVTAWVLFHDRVDVGPGASATVDAIEGLKDQLGTGAFAAALSFLAFLLGALWEPAATALQRWLWYLRTEFLRLVSDDRRAHPDYLSGREEGHNGSEPPRRLRISKACWQQLWSVALRLFSDIDEQVRTRLRIPEIMDDPSALIESSERASELAQFVQREGPGAREAPVEYPDLSKLPTIDEAGVIRVGFSLLAEELGADPDSDPEKVRELMSAELAKRSVGSERSHWWVRELSPLVQRLPVPSGIIYLGSYEQGSFGYGPPLVVEKAEGSYEASVLRLGAIANRIFQELPLSARRLVGEEQELFLEVDRMQGEISFRFALALPVAVTTMVLAVGLSLPSWAAVGVVLAGWVAGGALLRDGWRRDIERNDLLVSLLAIDKAKSPTFERLRSRAEAIERLPTAAEAARGLTGRAEPLGVDD